MATDLIEALSTCPEVVRIVWTRNIPEPNLPRLDGRVILIENAEPRGFGANHNAAFRECREPFFCVLNPDIAWRDNPFPALLATIDRERAALVAPEVHAPSGRIEDSMRNFPTVQTLLAKALHGEEGRAQRPASGHLIYPDWVAGMFMLMRSTAFETVGGFDESYFLYYEDIVLCAQLKAAGCRIVGDLSVGVTHRAQRASHHNWQHMKWHLTSMARYLWRSLRRPLQSNIHSKD